MDPLNADDKLKQEKPEKEREEVANRSIWELVHDRTQWVTQEEAESDVKSRDIESKELRENQNLFSQDRRHCSIHAHRSVSKAAIYLARMLS
jgi:hypothetical protein